MKVLHAIIHILVYSFLSHSISFAEQYFPQPEHLGGWRKNTNPDFIASLGIDPLAVKRFGQYNLAVRSKKHSSAIVIKDGYIVGEWYSSPEARNVELYLSSVGKTFALACFGIAVKDSKDGILPYHIDKGSKVYDARWLPSGFPLSDERKRSITFNHLFTHTSGLAPQKIGEGKPVGKKRESWSDYEKCVVGHDDLCPQTKPLYFTPGNPAGWSEHEQYGVHKAAYSSIGFSHLGLVIAELYKVPAYHMLWNRLLKPIGFSSIGFDRPPNPPEVKWSTGGGLKMTPRDFARFAYFLLHGGKWGEQQILPEDWLHQFVATPYYKNLRSNSDDFFGKQYPADMYRVYGSGGNYAFIIPSHNMIVIRTGRVSNFLHKVLQRDFLRRTFHMIPGISIAAKNEYAMKVGVISPE